MRRNLFNEEVVSTAKKAKLPRSQSVSALEGLKRKRIPESEGIILLLRVNWKKTVVNEGTKANL